MPDPICIEVPQVLDFCFQTETSDVCLPLGLFVPVKPATFCTCTGSTASCSLTNVTCSEVSRTPAATSGFFNVTFLVTFTLTVNIISAAGIVTCTATTTSNFFKTVILCAPDGATTVCDVTFSCGPCICIDDVVCCTFNLCLVFKSIFTVVLSVIGTVLTPTLCVTPGPFPPICPFPAPTVCVNCPPV